MKVLFVDQSGQCGGAELMLADLLRGLRGEVEVRVVLFDEGPFADLLRKEGFAVEVLPLKLRTTKAAGKLTRLLDLPLLGVLALKLAFRARGCDLIYANTPKAMVAGALAARLAGKRMLEKWVYRSADRVIAASEAFRRISIETYGVRADKVVAVPLAMDAGPFAAAAELPRKLARERLGWPADRRIVFCLRRLTRRMGLDRLVEAWRAVVAAHPDALLVIGGTGPLREELEGQVRRGGLGAQVMFAGFVPEKDLPMAYRAADFSVVPSVAMEGFGLVILESLAAGTPALVTPVGGMPEIMRPLEAGLVLPGAGVAEVERGLTDLLAGRLPVPEERACVEYVRRNYNWELAARRVMEVYAAAARVRRAET